MIDGPQVCELCEEWARIFGEWVEEDSMEDDQKDLLKVISMLQLSWRNALTGSTATKTTALR